jgi:hypothetical protein
MIVVRIAIGLSIVILVFRFVLRSAELVDPKSAMRWKDLTKVREEADNDIEYRSSRKNHPAGKKRKSN